MGVVSKVESKGAGLPRLMRSISLYPALWARKGFE